MLREEEDSASATAKEGQNETVLVFLWVLDLLRFFWSFRWYISGRDFRIDSRQILVKGGKW
jgi:hypothetical protein